MFLWSWMRGASVQQEYLTLVGRHSAPRAETDPCMHATSVVPICGFVHRKPSCRGALVRAPDALNEVSWATLCLLCCLTTPTVTSLSVRWKRLELAEPLPKGLIIVNGIVCPDYSRNGGGRSEGGRERERERVVHRRGKLKAHFDATLLTRFRLQGFFRQQHHQADCAGGSLQASSTSDTSDQE